MHGLGDRQAEFYPFQCLSVPKTREYVWFERPTGRVSPVSAPDGTQNMGICMVWETDRQSFARFSACRYPKHGNMHGLRDRQAEFRPFQRLSVPKTREYVWFGRSIGRVSPISVPDGTQNMGICMVWETDRQSFTHFSACRSGMKRPYLRH